MAAKPIAHRLPEMTNKKDETDESKWTYYKGRVDHNWEEHIARPAAVLHEGDYLYHQTGRKVLHLIARDGLCPRDPRWQVKIPRVGQPPRYDASKDGYLSMATDIAGTGAMGGVAVLLRMRVEADIAAWDFRRVGGGTEVRTTLRIPPDRLEYSYDMGETWTPLTDLPA